MALSAIIGEVALRRGPRDILKEQLEHLVDASHRPNVRIRLILAESEGIHVGLGAGSSSPACLRAAGPVLTFEPGAWLAFVRMTRTTA